MGEGDSVMMGTAFDSFDESPLGGFVQSPLGERGSAQSWAQPANFWISTSSSTGLRAVFPVSPTVWTSAGGAIGYRADTGAYSTDNLRWAGGIVYGGELYAARVGAGAGNMVQKRAPGGSFSVVGSVTDLSDRVRFLEHDGDLWIHGRFRIGATTYSAARLEGGSFVGYLAVGTAMRDLTSFGGNLYASTTGNAYEWDGAAFNVIPWSTLDPDYFVIASGGFLGEADSRLWMIGQASVRSPSGSATIINTLLASWDGANSIETLEGTSVSGFRSDTVISPAATVLREDEGLRIFNGAAYYGIDTFFGATTNQQRIDSYSAAGTRTEEYTLSKGHGLFKLGMSDRQVSEVTDDAGYMHSDWQVLEVRKYGNTFAVHAFSITGGANGAVVGTDLADSSTPTPGIAVWNGSRFVEPDARIGFGTASLTYITIVDTGDIAF